MKCPHCNNEFDMPRDPNISHSAFGQWVHDNFPNNFFWSDVDGIVFKRATRILRVMEEKRPGQTLKDSQRTILPLLARGVSRLVDLGIIHPQSGVFIIYTEPPYTTATISQVDNYINKELSTDEFKSFITGLEITK